MTGSVLPKSQFFRLKAATRDLIDMAGGIERAAGITAHGKSTVQRWRSAEHADVMPLTAVLLLEADTGSPLVTRAMAALQGFDLVATGGQGDEVRPGLLQRWAAFNSAFSALAGGMAFAMADGEVTVTETREIDAAAASLAAQIESLRQQLAGHNGKPLKVVKQVVS